MLDERSSPFKHAAIRDSPGKFDDVVAAFEEFDMGYIKADDFIARIKDAVELPPASYDSILYRAVNSSLTLRVLLQTVCESEPDDRKNRRVCSAENSARPAACIPIVRDVINWGYEPQSGISTECAEAVRLFLRCEISSSHFRTLLMHHNVVVTPDLDRLIARHASDSSVALQDIVKHIQSTSPPLSVKEGNGTYFPFNGKEVTTAPLNEMKARKNKRYHIMDELIYTTVD